MATLTNIQAEYKSALQDKGATLEEINGVPPSPANDVRDRAIAEAINRYSLRVPRIQTSLIAAAADGYYGLPGDWQVWSRIIQIEFPLNASPPTYLSRKSVSFQQRETGGGYYYLSPNPGSSFRLSYTTLHGGGTDLVASIVLMHEPLIGKWAAAIAALEFAARYANSVSNNLDAVNYRTKEQEWRAVHDKLVEWVNSGLRQFEFSQAYATDQDAVYGKGWRL